MRHNLSAAITYNIPKLRGGTILSGITRDWSLDSTIYGFSGQPFNLFDSGSLVRPDGTKAQVRLDLVPGIPLWIDDSSAPGGRRLNPAAFQRPPRANGNPVRQGTLGRNVVRRPGSYQVNLALRRQFNFSEKWNLQFKAEAFNLFNHPTFDNYDTRIFRPAVFGRPTTTLNKSLGGLSPLYQIGGSRSMQFSLRLSF